MINAIKTVNLSRYFGRVIALEDINIEINKGEIFGLLGPNGSGKSTLIKILSTSLLPSKGEAYVHDYDVKKDYMKIRKIINVVSGDERSGYGVLTLKENLWFFSQLYGFGIKEGWKIVNSLIEEFNMKEFADRRLNKVSHGMFQKYNFVRSILNNPKVLFLDEPTLGLDVEIAREIRGYVKKWIKENKERTVLLTTHYMAEAQELCDRIAIIHRGKIIKVDTVENLLKIISKEYIYEIKSSLINDKYLDKIKKIEGVNTVYIENDPSILISRIRIVLNDESYFADIISMLKENNIKIYSLSKEEPNLEDVFLYLVGSKLR